MDQAVAAFAFTQSPIALRGVGQRAKKYHEHANRYISAWARNNHDLAGAIIGLPDENIVINGVVHRMPAVRLDDRIYQRFLDPWFVKQTLAIWYDFTQRIFSSNGAISVHSFTAHERTKLAGIIRNMPFNFTSPPKFLVQGEHNTSEQFSYNIEIKASLNIGICLIELHRGISLVTCVADQPDKTFDQNARLVSSDRLWRTNPDRGIHFIEPLLTR